MRWLRALTLSDWLVVLAIAVCACPLLYALATYPS